MRPPPPADLTRDAMWEIILDLRAEAGRLKKRCAAGKLNHIGKVKPAI